MTSRRGSVQLDSTDPRHGTDNAYNNLGCRCSRCKSAHAEWSRAARARRAKATDRIPHGTESGYRNHGCRCRECKTAASAHYYRNKESA